MITIIHDNHSVQRVLNSANTILEEYNKTTITKTLFNIAEQFPNELVLWCHQAYENVININELDTIFHHQRIMASFSFQEEPFLGNDIGFVNDSIFVNINKSVSYPTWLMHSDIGGIQSTVLNKIRAQFDHINNFDYLLNAIAKVCMPLGLFCYSEPSLLKENAPKLSIANKASTSALFKFVKMFYKPIWSWLLFVCFVIYKRKFPILPFLANFLGKHKNIKIDLSSIPIQSSRELVSSNPTVDVIIPTIGRKKYLYDVLKDLSVQTLLPKQVIVVEQNPNTSSVSDLDYLTNEFWPFAIKHHFIHQTGACNARNLALSEVTSEWVFLADDDNRFENNVIELFLDSIRKYGEKALLSIYLQPKEENLYKLTTQTDIFGAGNSFIKSCLLNKSQFDMAFEYGYGEDKDFGMQIRNQGNDILYDTNINITHLKAPRGGFREVKKQPWENEKTIPKPAPTISVYNLKHLTKEQMQGYKLKLFFKYYKHQKIKEPISYYNNFMKQWNSSLNWGKRLING
jgi:glycosyltransferase involved in cell wall biosynthesis